VAAGAVRDEDTLRAFLEGRMRTTGVVDAWLAAAACAGGDPARFEAECEARCPSPALRAASRAQGRGLRRAGAAAWPSLADVRVEQQPVVLGLVARAAGLTPLEAAWLVLHGIMSGGASAAVRLLAIDMSDAMGVVVALGATAEELATEAATMAELSPERGPAWSAPSLELRAEDHARWEVRLFAS
jgi:urease accessory protein